MRTSRRRPDDRETRRPLTDDLVGLLYLHDALKVLDNDYGPMQVGAAENRLVVLHRRRLGHGAADQDVNRPITKPLRRRCP
jgi:hypothetical protein